MERVGRSIEDKASTDKCNASNTIGHSNTHVEKNEFSVPLSHTAERNDSKHKTIEKSPFWVQLYRSSLDS